MDCAVIITLAHAQRAHTVSLVFFAVFQTCHCKQQQTIISHLAPCASMSQLIIKNRHHHQHLMLRTFRATRKIPNATPLMDTPFGATFYRNEKVPNRNREREKKNETTTSQQDNQNSLGHDSNMARLSALAHYRKWICDKKVSYSHYREHLWH